MLEGGYLVRLGIADPIHHMESPKRDLSRMDYFGRRNDILFTSHNVPMPYLPVHLIGTTLNGVATAVQKRRLKHMLRGLVRGWTDSWRFSEKRSAVSKDTYLLYRRLKKAGPWRLSEIESMLPELQILSRSELPVMNTVC
jgi:hypothetical protein